MGEMRARLRKSEMTTLTELDGLIARLEKFPRFGRFGNDARWMELGGVDPVCLQAATALRQLQEESAAKQAHIDRLMLEYCPDEMTPEQLAEWGRHQRPVSPEVEAQVQAALAKPDRRVAQRRVVRTLRIGFRDERNADRRKQEGSK